MTGSTTAAASTWNGAPWTAHRHGAPTYVPSGDPRKIIAIALALADAAIVLLAAPAAWALRYDGAMPPAEIVYAALLGAVLNFNGMRASGAYGRHLGERLVMQAARAARVWLLVLLALLAIGYITKTSGEFSRLWAVCWFVLAIGGFALTRGLAWSQVRRWRVSGRLASTVAIVDISGNGEVLAKRLQDHASQEIRIVGIFQPRRGPAQPGGVDDLIALSRRYWIDEVVVAVSDATCNAELDAVVRHLGSIPTNVRLCPALPNLSLVLRGAGMLGDCPVVTVYQRPLPGLGSVAKRAEDLLLGTLFLMAALPALLLIALAIRLDSPGPVLFRQQRHGFNNNAFTVFKFRTMVHRTGPEQDVPQATRDDPRVTRVGAILRRTSLDELPQLLNVLRGEMSLVGPRPHAVAHNEFYAAEIDDYLGRHRVQPGITGWAQVHGLRGETDTLEKMKQRVAYDLYYIDNWSIFLDLRIILRTAFTVLFHRNAY